MRLSKLIATKKKVGFYISITEGGRKYDLICEFEINGNINGANVGEEAPDFNLEIVANGTGTFQLSDYLCQIVVLAFFSPM